MSALDARTVAIAALIDSGVHPDFAEPAVKQAAEEMRGELITVESALDLLRNARRISWSLIRVKR